MEAWVISGLAVVVLLKVYLASQLGLFQDEAFYWLESRFLALSYSDIPPLTAWAVRAGTGLLGGDYLGVRLFFLLAGCSTPLLMYWFARPLVGAPDAWKAAGLALALPLMIGVGPLAVADSLLVAIGVAFMGAFERATRTGAIQFWLLSGLLVALGFLCHYRFAPLALAGALYLLLTVAGRAHLRRPGPWLCAVIGLLGLAPVLWFNAVHHQQALSYQFLERHPWAFDSKGFVFMFRQLLLVTPLLFGFLVLTWMRLARGARDGNDRYCLLWWFATLGAGVYFMLSPFMGHGYANYHWPLVGYLPLLVVAPRVLGTAPAWLSRSTVALAAVASVALALMLLMQAHTNQLWQRAPGLVFPHNSNFVGWREMADRASVLQQSLGSDLVIGDHYGVAAQLMYHGAPRAYTIDGAKARSDGRALQFRIWSLDEQALAGHGGKSALVVFLAAERGKYRPQRRYETLSRLCRLFGSVQASGALELWGGVKVFEYYHAEGLGDGPARNCPLQPERSVPRGQGSSER